MNTDKIPTSWANTYLNEVGQWGSGGTPSRRSAENYGGDIKWLKTGELGPKVVHETEEKITENGLNNSSAKIFEAGCIAIAMYGATIGKTSILGCDMATNQACAVISIDDGVVDRNFLYHFLSSQKEAFANAGQGGAQPNISQKVIKEWPLPLPPKNEQRRIADKLDKTLAAVEACKQKLNNAAETIQRFRQSVLAAAVSGELTNNQNQFSEKQISDVCTVVRGASPRPAGDPRYFTDDPKIPWITVGEITKDEEKYLESTKTFLTDAGKARSRLINEHTLLLTNSGATLGVPKITLISGRINDGSVALEGLSEPLKTYLYYVLKSKTQELRNIKQGAAQPNLNTTIVKNISFSCPDSEYGQTKVINKIETLFGLADLIEKQISQAKVQVDAIRNSVLAKAFRGELVDQDPNDEPASVLLERIKAQREAEAEAKKPAKRGRKKKTDTAQLGIPGGIADNHLAKVLQECGALSQRALLAASELEPAVFQLQISKELKTGVLKQVAVDGEAAYADAAWEKEG